LFAYPEIVSSTCRVSFTDGADVTHSVTVSASSLYEAAVLGIAGFKKSGFAFASIGPATRLTIAVEAKCKQIESGVGVKELARLISRLRHRQFGILVTTSFLSEQAYKELRDDQHPVMVVAAADIARILTDAGLKDETAVSAWLRESFPRPEDRSSAATSGVRT
jgi:hypothetical protein